jgi:hypothetical protein
MAGQLANDLAEQGHLPGDFLRYRLRLIQRDSLIEGNPFPASVEPFTQIQVQSQA